MADVKFTDLPAAILPLVGSEIFAAVQGGASVSLTADDLAALAGGGAVDSVNGQTGAVSLGLSDLDDVDTTGAADGDVLTWDNGAGEWVPEAPTGGGIPDAPSDGTLYGRKDGDWEVVPAGGGGVQSIVAGSGITVDDTDPENPVVSADGGASHDLTIITESSAFDVDPATHSGRHRLILAGGDVTFDVSEGYAAGNVFSIVATAAIELITTGVTLTPPAGGTLDLSADMAVSIVMTSSSAGRIIGQTVAA